MCNKTPHKHAAVIKAWADGAKIEFRPFNCEWRDLKVKNPAWHEDTEYRIKPEPKPDVVRYGRVDAQGNVGYFSLVLYPEDNLKLTFDGETGKLKKAEVI